MILQKFRRINVGDYPVENQPLVQKLSYSLNSALDSVYDALNKKLTFADNLKGEMLTLEVRVDSTGTPASILNVSTSIDGEIQGLIPIKVEGVVPSGSNPVYAQAGVVVSFTQQSKQITITNITGLTSNQLYRIKILTVY